MSGERVAKRQRMSPFDEDTKIVSLACNVSESMLDSAAVKPNIGSIGTKQLLERATYVLAKEAAAVASVANLYSTDAQAQEGLENAVQAILRTQRRGGKLIICGVGKSAYIAMKTVATCKSLGIAASFLHACEAVHGDLGDVRPIDILLFLSFSGRTPELLNVLPHVPAETTIMAMSSHSSVDECPLLSHRDGGILLTAPIPEPEDEAFGVAAPTLSTTVAIAVADMLALTVADQMHQARTIEVFRRNHPGGAIGMTNAIVQELNRDPLDYPVVELPSPSISGSDTG